MSVVNKDALMAVIQPLTGLMPTSVTWSKNPQQMVSDIDRAVVNLSLKNFQQVGVDEHRYTYTPGLSPPSTATFDTAEVGQRVVTLQLKCEVYDYNLEAGELLDSVRTKLHAQAQIDALLAINLAYQSSKLIDDLPTTYDNRVVNVAILEVTFGALSSGYSVTQTAHGWISTVDDFGAPDGSSDIQGTYT